MRRLKKLFEINFVWSDTNPNDQTSFGATTICGNLLKEIVNNFTKTKEYEDFSEKFHQTFNHEDSGLKKDLKAIEEKTQAIFRDQFGDASISFRFNELKIDTFFKNTTIEVDDGVNTSMDEKGSGMQRSVALALLQVYAEELTKHPEGNETRKPFFLFIDEPEICLHPKAQEKLLHAILELSKTKQIFLATHSPYFLIDCLEKIFIFKKDGDIPVVYKMSDGSKLFPWSPTWGEINYKAYYLPTVQFHNELYGYLQEDSKKSRIEDFEKWLVSNKFQKIKQWTRETNGKPVASEDATLQTFIRNQIHHPENVTMQKSPFTPDELKQSIDEMIAIISGNGNESIGG